MIQILVIFLIVFVMYVLWKYWALSVGAGFDPAPMDKVYKMLRIAKVGNDDIVFDLGCGDGRVLIAAAKRFGARGVGIEIDPFRFLFAWFMTIVSGQSRRVNIVFGNFFKRDISDATAVVLFLYGPTNNRLKEKFERELKPGTRIVSYIWEFDGWQMVDCLPEDRIFVYEV
jgi:SAM-dependent methyltransferase